MALFHFASTFLYAITFLRIYVAASNTLLPNQTIAKGQTLISPNQIFELGFFSPGESNNSFLGLWYRNTPEVVVWVANRNDPITNSEGLILSFSRNGTVVVITDGGIVWRTNSSRAAVNPVLQLLDTGNLVVVDDDGGKASSPTSYVWQSFDYPTNTRLPGMSMVDDLVTGTKKYLTSWRNSNDPLPGNFTFQIENKGLPQLVILRGTTKMYRTGQWNGLYLGGIPHSGNLFRFVTVTNNAGRSSVTETYNSSMFTRLTLEESGFLDRYLLNERRDKWNLEYTVPRDTCDNYARCGPNGVCRIDKDPLCVCLKGYEHEQKDDWDWSTGCTRSRPLNCEGDDGFLAVEGVKLPDMVKSWLNMSMSLVECRDACLKNCNCTAYANAYVTDGGSGCWMWHGDLVDVKELTGANSKQILYLRLPISELESNNNLDATKTRKKPRKLVLISILTAAGVLTSCLICWGIFVMRRLKRREDYSVPIFSTAMNLSNEDNLELPLFKLATISAATNNFSDENLLGEGGFGPVYRGNLSKEEKIAVKRLSEASNQGLQEFKNEVVLIAQLQHRNLVRVLGCCIEGNERLLIYEYMENRSLDHFVFDANRRKLLTWPKRFEIIMGISRGLIYLHHDSRLKIVHRDLKTSNILLDENLNPKISDFGLARIFGGDQTTARTKRVVGTYGYMAPEYAIDGKFSVKSDVFSMGVVLLEIVSGNKNRDFNHSNHYHSLLGHAWLLWREDRILELMDECLINTCNESQIKRCIQVGLLCVQKFQEDRPDMSSVLFMLGSEGVPLSEPTEPGFFVERSCGKDTNMSSTTTESYGNSITITNMEPR